MESHRAMLFSLLFVLFVVMGVAKKSSVSDHRHHHTQNGKCKHVMELEKAGDDDDFEDVEDPIIPTYAPPNHPQDPFINTETDDNYIDSPPDVVDFIVIKHRFSNATNLAFPPYAYVNKNKKGDKKRSGIKSSPKKRQKKITKPSPPSRVR